MKLCPFCAGKGEVKDLLGPVGEIAGRLIRCSSCKARGPSAKSPDEAIALWDRRPLQSTKPQENADKPIESVACNKGPLCNQEIFFLKYKKKDKTEGKMPVNAESVNDEDRESLAAGENIWFRYKDHVSHFSNCAYAEDVRKGRR